MARRGGRRRQPRYKPPPRPARPQPVTTPQPLPVSSPYTDLGFASTANRVDAQTPGIQAQYGNPSLGPNAPFAQRYGQEGQQLATQYGLTPGYQTDPYSLAKQLEQTYQQSRLGTMGQMAGRGQYYSTAYDAAQQANQTNFAQGQSDLQKQYQQGLTGITSEATERLGALDQERLGAFQSAMDRMVSQTPGARQPLTQPVTAAQKAAYAKQLAAYRKQVSTGRAQTRARRQYTQKGHQKGKQWKAIIKQLGYDPRKGGKLRFR